MMNGSRPDAVQAIASGLPAAAFLISRRLQAVTV